MVNGQFAIHLHYPFRSHGRLTMKHCLNLFSKQHHGMSIDRPDTGQPVLVDCVGDVVATLLEAVKMTGGDQLNVCVIHHLYLPYNWINKKNHIQCFCLNKKKWKWTFSWKKPLTWTHQFDLRMSSSLLAHIIKEESWWTRGVLYWSGVNSFRSTCSASKTRPSSKYSKYFCSSNKNFIS